ncbi:MAG: LacI family DNA-binding transcriptional regulator [Catenulispora sp.]
MRDVAARAQVSFKTVSRVVNDEAGVSPALARRVRRAIDELDFQPNAGARNLRRSDRRTSSVGLLLENVANPFSAALQRAVEDIATPRGVIVFSGSVEEDPERERTLVREFSARRADGLLLVPASADQSYLAGELRAGTAVVCVDREASGLAVDSVVTTNELGAAEGVRHLAARGHRRIAFLGDRRTITTEQQRYQGYCDALGAAGLPLDPALVVPDMRSSALAEGAVVRLLSQPDPPTALFTAQNLITIGAVRALRRIGSERQVAVVGFDDFPLADLLSPGVTVVAQDPTAIGRLAATLLFDRIAGRAGPPTTHVLPTTLIHRGSGEIPAPA